jgi:hypothetical protein
VWARTSSMNANKFQDRKDVKTTFHFSLFFVCD